MKHAKMLGMLVMAAASLMAFAGSASAASVLTSPPGTNAPINTTIHATLETGTTALLKAGIEDTCKESTAHGLVTVNNGSEAEGSLTETFTFEGAEPTGLHWGGCTQDTKTIKAGKLTINDNGEVFTKESRVEIKVTGLGITCFYGAETGSVKIGTFTSGETATLDVSTTTLQREKGSNETFCALNGAWTASYKITSPDSLFLT